MNNFKLLTSICSIGLLFFSNLYAAHDSIFGFVKKDAMTIERTSSFEIPMTPSEALPLFTAPEEILWVPGWNPNILNGNGFEQGTVWLTQYGEVFPYKVAIRSISR